MQNISKYRALFADKLATTDDFQQAFTKAIWVAFTDGVMEGGKPSLWTDDDERRIDIIGQNSNEGLHYDSK